MSQVTFPGLGIELNVSHTAFQIGNIGVRWYAILIVLAIIIAMIAYKKRDGKFGIKYEDILDLSLYTLPIAVISSRIYFIIFNLGTYLTSPASMFNLRTRRPSNIRSSYWPELSHATYSAKNEKSTY